MFEALLYEKMYDKKVRCNLCNHFCVIKDGDSGICRVRVNKQGVLYSLAYGRVVAENVDPIEKKPLFHFLPGSKSYSISTVGCNFQCGFCQNYEIAQAPQMGVFPDVPLVDSKDIVKKALKYNCKTMSYTYTEPTIFFEFALDCCKIAKQQGLRNVFVTNGFMSSEALEMIAPYLDAANVDVKGGDEFYKSVCKAKLQPVLDNIKRMRECGIWVEITTLVIPEYNDTDNAFDRLSKALFGIDPEMPWHFSRFFPTYKFANLHPTPVETVDALRKKALSLGFKYIYAGNMGSDDWEDTRCLGCSTIIIRRQGFSVLQNNIKQGRCPACLHRIGGVFD